MIFVPGRNDDTWTYADRLKVKCPEHEDCTRSRSLALGIDKYGPRAAEAFLAVWLQHAHVSRREHREFKPTNAQMQAYLVGEPLG